MKRREFIGVLGGGVAARGARAAARSNKRWLCQLLALDDFRCIAQNSVGIGGVSDIKAGLRRAEIRFF
jgi:hypothetical protein